MLREREYKGLIVIQSANDEKDDVQRYIAAGADAAIGKAVHGGPRAMLNIMAHAWHAKYGIRAPAAG